MHYYYAWRYGIISKLYTDVTINLSGTLLSYLTSDPLRPPPPPPPPPPQERLDELSELWKKLLDVSIEKRLRLQNAQKREHFVREADEVSAWISDREAVASSEELGNDLEHVKMLQKNFVDFLKVCACQTVLNEEEAWNFQTIRLGY